jgi:type II secretory pathway component PulM
MQTGKRMSERETMQEVVRALMGIVLFMLVAGVWACLWIPPSL